MMWAFLAIALVELVVVHVLLALWSPWIAIGISVVSVTGLGWLILMLRSLKRMPVVVRDDVIVFRTGSLLCLCVARANVARLRPDWNAEALKAPDILKLSLLAYPNVVVELVDPVDVVRLGRVRRVTAIAHRLDDPAGFAAALAFPKP